LINRQMKIAGRGALSFGKSRAKLLTRGKNRVTFNDVAGIDEAREEVQETGALPVPFVIRNAPTPLMQALGYGKGYLYDHDFPDHYAPQEYFPEGIKHRKFYQPADSGFEKEIKRRLQWWEEKKREFSQKFANQSLPLEKKDTNNDKNE
ncbi:MAG: hypothetical protein N2246_09670, partial [Candidatus Sumerlaeia bacterium]|nr:hypothetical protein [Candidatus Sumerlaeia bacterium]